MVENSGGGNKQGEAQGSGGNRGRSRRRRRGKKSGGGGGEGRASGGNKPTTQARAPEPGRSKKKRSKSGKGNKAKSEPEAKPEKPLPKPRKHIIKKYDIILFDTFAAAHAAVDKISEKTKDCDQLNVVIRAEGDMDDPTLTAIDKVKVFAGTAWTTIHERRVEDGWYTEPR